MAFACAARLRTIDSSAICAACGLRSVIFAILPQRHRERGLSGRTKRAPGRGLVEPGGSGTQLLGERAALAEPDAFHALDVPRRRPAFRLELIQPFARFGGAILLCEKVSVAEEHLGGAAALHNFREPDRSIVVASDGGVSLRQKHFAAVAVHLGIATHGFLEVANG